MRFLEHNRVSTLKHSLLAFVRIALCVTLIGSVFAQEGQLNPSDIFLQAYFYEKDAKKLFTEGKYDEAVTKCGKAQSLLNTLHLNYPNRRREYVQKAFTRISQIADDCLKAKTNSTDSSSPQLFTDKNSSASKKQTRAQTKEAVKNNVNLDELTKKMAAVQQKLELKKMEAEALKKQESSNGDLAKTIQGKDQKISELESAVDSEKKNSEVRQKLLVEEIAALRAEIANNDGATNETVNKLRSQLDTLEIENTKLIQDKAKAESGAKTIQDSLKNLTAENTSLKATLKKSEETYGSELEELKIEIDKLNEIKAKVLANNLNGRADNTKEELLKEEIEELHQAKQDLFQKRDSELRAYEEKEKQNATEIAKLKNQLRTEHEAIKLLSAEENTAFEKVMNLTSMLEVTRTDKEKAESKLALAEGSIESLNSEIVALQQEKELLMMRPLKSEMEALKQDLVIADTERKTLSKNLSTNEGKYYEALDRIELLQTELETARKVSSKIEEDMSAERNIANDVIKSQRERLKKQSEELTQTKAQLAEEQAKARELNLLVKETKEQYFDIKEKHDSLLEEHSQLKLLISGNSNEEQLKTENLKLKRDLNTARNEFSRALKNADKDKETLLITKKQYALARTDLIKSKHELELSNLRGDKLLTQLQKAKNDLAENTQDSSYTPEEVSMLKGLVDQQMRLQKNRQVTRSLILDEVRRLGIDDANFLNALDLQETQELVLSDEQQRLLANQDADGEFRFTDRATPAERKKAEAALNQRLNIHENLGRSAYQKGHYLAAEEFFQINLDDHPGHVPSMLNLGVSRLRKAQRSSDQETLISAIQSFEDAVAMTGDEGLPYATQMLGYTYYHMGKDDLAAEYFHRSLEETPNNARAHIFLASLAANNNNLADAEKHLKSAIEIDPTLSEPHYNFAVLLHVQGKTQAALKQYREAIAKGANPDAKLESELSIAIGQTSAATAQ